MSPTNVATLTELTAPKLVIVAGKGGVGKTTVTAVLARAAAMRGRRVLAVELDGRPALAELLRATEADPADDVAGGVTVRSLTASAALAGYLADHGFRRIARRLASSGVIEVIGTAAPGVDDLVVLGQIKQWERSGEWDLIVVDGPAAGHALTFLTSAAGLLDATRGGPVHEQADAVVTMLRDPARSQVVLVTVPETTPVNELIEASYAIEERVGVQLGPIVVNQVDRGDEALDPSTELRRGDAGERAAAAAAAEFRTARRAGQAEEIARLAGAVPLPLAMLPSLTTRALGAGDIDELAARLAETA